MVKTLGTCIVFVNSDNKVLLFLRDTKEAKPHIPFPSTWDFLGGHVEEGETPEVCIRREVKEEIGRQISPPLLFKEYDFADRTDFVYWQQGDIDKDSTVLTEGQKLDWYSEDQIRKMPDNEFAFDVKRIALDFFAEWPFLQARPS